MWATRHDYLKGRPAAKFPTCCYANKLKGGVYIRSSV
jgi:hypothetical protein